MNDVIIKGLSLDSRRVKPNYLFIALKGLTSDGRQYIPQAIEKGAAAIFIEKCEDNAAYLKMAEKSNIPIIEYPNLKNCVGFIAADFYNQPSSQIAVVGITGTNGKTSCSHFIAEICNSLGKITGVIGTLGSGFLGDLDAFGLTTPDAITLQEILSHFKQAGAKVASLEVTSHALSQGRVNGVQFHTTIFTNLTRDHLDYHETMEDYFQAKKRLFLEYPSKFSIINLDDPKGLSLISEIAQSKAQKIGITLDAKKIQLPEGIEIVSAENIIENDQGIKAHIKTPWGETELYCPLLGRFNLTNALTALTACCLQGLPLEQVAHRIRTLTPVPGRMNRLGGGLAPQIVIDFAHTPDALSKVLSELKPHCQGKLWCVFGCGGDRDPGKRPQMASVVAQFCEKIVVTQDNPRMEDGNKIIQDIMKGFKTQDSIVIEPDRAKAIEFAISKASSDDIILIAGKGHETYQIIQNEKKPFSDEVSARVALARRQK